MGTLVSKPARGALKDIRTAATWGHRLRFVWGFVGSYLRRMMTGCYHVRAQSERSCSCCLPVFWGSGVTGSQIGTEACSFLFRRTIFPVTHTSGFTAHSEDVSEFGVSVDANELNLFTHSKSALVHFECKMSTGIFNVWNLSSVFTPIFAQTSPPPLRIYCGFDLCCLKPLKTFQRSRAVFFLFFLLFFPPAVHWYQEWT